MDWIPLNLRHEFLKDMGFLVKLAHCSGIALSCKSSNGLKGPPLYFIIIIPQERHLNVCNIFEHES